MASKKGKRLLKDSQTPALSANICETKPAVKKKFDMQEVAEKVFNEVNRKELEKSLDKWLKDNHTQNAIAMRDLGLLKAIVSEYLDSFIVFGYNLDGERIILQNYEKARDRDAIMEFLKTIFIKQQQENFLD
jgi:hypothetical protein